MLNKLASLREKSEDGFTLIELLIVVVIIGILAAIAIPIFLNQQKAALSASVKSDVRNTVTNVATELTKNPQACFSSCGTGTAVTPTKVQTTGNTVNVTGNWSSYLVVGTNGSLSGDYRFTSTTGKYTGSGDMLQA